MERLPDFIIVGAMKSGTTSLGSWLNLHPEIYIPDQEIHYFDSEGGFKSNYNKGQQWYTNWFKNINAAKIVGEKTPTYSYLPDVPRRIYELVPNVKLIWILRDPVFRTYSNYWHAIINGEEKVSFINALKLEKERIRSNIWQGYMERSKYVNQIKNYLNYFPLDQMYFMAFEDLKANPNQELSKIFNFLEVEETTFDHSMFRKENKSNPPLNIPLRYFTSQILGKKSILSRIERKLNQSKKSYSKLSEYEIEFLKTIFEPFNKELDLLTNKEFSKKWN